MNPLPFFIITAGATGSGKTKLIDKTFKALGISSKGHVKILVDDLIENNKIYKLKIKLIIKKINKLCKNNIQCENDKYQNPDKTLLDDFSKAYYTVRKSKNCSLYMNHIRPKGYTRNLTCDELNDLNLKQAISTRKNIILEFTGSYIPKWILSKQWLGDYFNVIFSYTIVSNDILIERNKTRTINSINEFKNDMTKPAPRLPNINELPEKVELMKQILHKLYLSCIINYDTKICGTVKINRLLIFDNNIKFKLIFDSNINKLDNDEFQNIINKSFDFTGGDKLQQKYLKYKQKYLNYILVS